MIRSSLALATILGRTLRIHSIRKNRKNHGINNQLRSVFSIFTDKLPIIGQDEVFIHPTFTPPTHIASRTAASCTLMLQCFIPIFATLGHRKSVKL